MDFEIFFKKHITQAEKKQFIEKLEIDFFEKKMNAQEVIRLIEEFIYVDKMSEYAAYISFPDFEHRIWKMYCRAKRRIENDLNKN